MTTPLARTATVSDAASAAASFTPPGGTRLAASAPVHRRWSRRNSLLLKQAATAKNARIPEVSDRKAGMKGQYGALRSSGRKLARRHTLAQTSPAPYARPKVSASSASKQFCRQNADP